MPVQVIPKVAFAVSAPVLCDPLAASVPDQPPEPMQPVAFVALQVSTELLPLLTVVGLAPNATVGAAADTVTVADCAAVPPVPVQVKV